MLCPRGVYRRTVLFAGLVSCQAHQDTAAKPAAPPPFAVQLQAASRRMHERYNAALGMEAALATGDMGRVRAQARVIDALDEPDFLPRWQPFVASVRIEAHRVTMASSTQEAAPRVAAVGRACARCHEEIQATIAFPSIPLPQATTIVTDDMQRHQWDGLQMWEGLLAPSDELWRKGATGLAAMPPNALAQAATLSPGDGLDDVARIRRDAVTALTTTDQDVRAELFGRLLATCAHCHARLRDL